MLHILGPRVEREERAGDPVAEVRVVLVVPMFWHAAFAGVCRATKAEVKCPRDSRNSAQPLCVM